MKALTMAANMARTIAPPQEGMFQLHDLPSWPATLDGSAYSVADRDDIARDLRRYASHASKHGQAATGERLNDLTTQIHSLLKSIDL